MYSFDSCHQGPELENNRGRLHTSFMVSITAAEHLVYSVKTHRCRHRIASGVIFHVLSLLSVKGQLGADDLFGRLLAVNYSSGNHKPSGSIFKE